MLKNKKIRNIVIVLIVLIIPIGVIYVNYKNNNIDKKEYISKVLKTDAYSYLPEEAKEYIEKVYEETGNVLFTEKNKIENVPYLNPKYVEYLSYMNNSTNEKDIDKEEIKYDIIPNETIIDYIYTNNTTLNNDELPTSFNLNNYNGKDYVTSIKDQKSSGLCWAFATNSQVESYLLLKNNLSYDENTSKRFSERQLDYATSINGILDYDNFKYGNRMLFHGGGNFYYASDLMKDGLGLVDDSFKEFINNDYSKMELNEVYNYKNSNYEVNNTFYVPNLDLTNPDNASMKDSYLDLIKNLVISYGGAFVGTQGPTYSCSSLNVNDNFNSHIIREDNYCTADAGHAMHIIGWDDNYSYKYCVDGNEHSIYSSNCKNSIEGTGAWILKNSWGNVDKLDYVYLAYDSLNSIISVVSDISNNDDRTWNKSYEEVINEDNYIASNSEYVIRYMNIEDTIKNDEKLSKIKLFNQAQNAKYYLFYASNNNSNNLELISTIDSPLPGIYTIDIDNKNLNIKDGKFYLGLKISGSDKDILATILSYVEFDFYTINNNIEIKTKDSTYINRFNTKDSDDYKLYIYSDTIGLNSNEVIEYELYDLEGNNLTNFISYTNNNVANNNVRSILNVDSSLEVGEYLLKTIYQNEIKSESKIFLREIKGIKGSGTKLNPYIITTPDELNMINDNMNAYYVLGNDIDMTHATQNKNGIFYNEGRGWIPIGGFDNKVFGGSLDGRGYSIIGLYKNNSKYNGGLFKEIGYTTKLDIDIKNINFKDCHIHSLGTYNESGTPNYTSSEGILAYTISDLNKDYPTSKYYYIEDNISININNISIDNSVISGYKITGGLIGTIDTSKNNSININNIFSNSKVLSSYDDKYLKGGIIGYILVNNSIENNANVNIKDILNIGYVDTNPYLNNEYYSGGIIGTSFGRIDLSNIISNVKIINDTNTGTNVNYGSVVGALSKNTNYSGTSSLNNIYYVGDYNYILASNYNFNKNNILKKSLLELKDNNLITNWNNWEIKEIDNIKRIPMLKFVDFDYTKIEDIKIKLNEEINLYDLINPNIDMAKDIEYEIKDTSIASIDEEGNIKPNKLGETTIHIISYYDGYENEVKLSLYKEKYKITFESNGGSIIEPIEGYKGDIITEPEHPTKKYYKFAGWYIDKELTNKFIFDKMPEENVTIYAKWDKYKTTITFNSNKGSSVNSITNYAGDKVNIPTNPIKEGYKFDGWYKEKELKNKYVFDVMPEKDITLYAKWLESYKYIINKYDTDDKYIKSISVNTKLEDYKKSIELNDGYTVEVDYKTVNNNKVLFTGGKTKIYKDKKIEKEFINVVTGDINGDGSINSADLLRVRQHLLGIKKSNNEYFIASDINSDNNINSADLLRIRQHLLGIKKIG